jgi:type I restriction enzyme R subunit
MSLNESETRAKLIDPALHAVGWTEDLIRREETAGAVEIVNGRARRRSHGRVDYTLRVKVTPDSQPVALALIEAKAEHLPPDHGLEQAKAYAESKRLNVPYMFSTNGHLFVMYNRLTGITDKPRKINEFPKPQDLRTAYETAMGFTLESEGAKPLLSRYSGGEATRRYYQDAAIRAVLEKIAKGNNRALLSLATGAGKTFIAVNLLKRIADAGQLKKALFICDRDELRAQGLAAFQNVFASNAEVAYRKADGTNNAKNARIHIATYQTLGVDSDDGDIAFLTEFYPENYFSHIIIDECHRSAWGKWSEILKRNQNAVQVGLTATPRQLGEPVYEYDMAQGMDDGYLAACERKWGVRTVPAMRLNKEGQWVKKAEYGRYYCRQEHEEHVSPDCPRTISSTKSDNDVWAKVCTAINKPEILLVQARKMVAELQNNAITLNDEQDQIQKELDALATDRQWIITQARRGGITENDMDYQLGEITLQELNLKREYTSIGQAVNIHALGDWEAKVKEYLADLQAGLDSLNVVPQNDEEILEIFEIKKHTVNTLVRRVTIDCNRELHVEISLNLLNLFNNDSPPKNDPGKNGNHTEGFEGKYKNKIKTAGIYPGWRYFF